METELDQRLQQAAFDRLTAAKALHLAREAHVQAAAEFHTASERHAAAVEAHCNIENEIACGMTRQSRLPLKGRAAA